MEEEESSEALLQSHLYMRLNYDEAVWKKQQFPLAWKTLQQGIFPYLRQDVFIPNS